ncbi:MAG: PilZ domain-containing protein, partial [Pyrinomonadaceae bacterium]
PRQLRCFDHVEQQYRVWALVRNIKPLALVEKDKLPRFEVGVAFVGKQPPASFHTDPTKRYQVAATATETGLYEVREQPEGMNYVRTDAPRHETRHAMAIDVTVEVFDEKGAVTARESTVTENISRRGAAVFTSLDVARGRFVRLTSSNYQIAVVAVVRVRRLGPDNIPRLHLEFIDKQWPLDEGG